MKKKLLAWLTAICLLTVALTPITGTWASEVPAETTQPTAEPTSEPKEEKKEEPTPAPVKEETTQAPVITEAPVVTETPTEEPTQVPTQEPTQTPTQEPTKEPTEEPTEEPTQKPEDKPEQPEDKPEQPEGPVEEFKPVIPEGFAPIMPDLPEIPDMVKPAADLKASISSPTRWVYAGERRIALEVKVSGGAAPYEMRIVIDRDGSSVDTIEKTFTESGKYDFAYDPAGAGIYKFKLSLTDANGNGIYDAVSVPVAEHNREEQWQWELSVDGIMLTGNWREDLVTIARSQLDYEESTIDFIVDDAGNRHGFTRYGAWYGSAYEEWCAMFVSFCLNYAGIPSSAFPREANCANWRSVLSAMGAYEDDEDAYTPVPGDLIFFVSEEKAEEDSNYPKHIGIVEKVTEDKVYTIEGNRSKKVDRFEYDLDDETIVGYGNMTVIIERAGKVDEGFEKEAVIEDMPLAPEYKIAVAHVDSNIRAEASVKSAVVAGAPAGVELKVVGAVTANGTPWYIVEINGVTGYIRGDLVALIAVEGELVEDKPIEDVPAEEPVVEPTDAPADIPVDEPIIEDIPVDEPIVELPAEPVLTVVAQPEADVYTAGAAEVGLTFNVENAVAYLWQQGAADENGEMVWTDIPGTESAAILINTTIDALKLAYRCVATDVNGNSIVSEPVTLISQTLIDWINDGGVDNEMLDRALKAESLEAMVLEEDALIYVRNGKVYARYDAATGSLIDNDTGLVVAHIDLESGMIYPVGSEAE